MVSFSETTFSGKVYFVKVVTFNHNVFFDRSIFNDMVYFHGAIFNGEVSFHGATFYDLTEFIDVKMEYPGDFSDVQFKENTVCKGLWNLTFGRIKRLHCTITEFIGFNTATVMDGASNPYLKRYIDDELWIQSWKDRSWWKRRLFFIWELSSHCGRSFTLWMFWSLLIACLFGVIYSNYDYPSWLSWFPYNWRPEFYISAIDRIPTGFTYYYFSIVAFTTLGFGDITPMNLAGEIWLAIEVILGYIMLGGLLSIFANKFARRS